jgi:poly(beta-D-mannuronate) lyase
MRWLALLAMIYAVPAFGAAPRDCVAAPDPIVALDYPSRYAEYDDSRATIDPLREAEAETAVAPVDAFIALLADEAGGLYQGSPLQRRASAECILNQMTVWARADALSQLRTETVRLTIGARYAGFALILWQTLPYAYDHPDRAIVLGWLTQRLADQQVVWEDASPGARQGNLRAWAGLAAAALAVQIEDQALAAWADAAVRDVVCSALPDGSLPQEMSRGPRALHYQLHATAPLVTAAALLERLGLKASHHCEGALHRVVDFVVSDLDRGSRTENITGEPQTLFGEADRLQPYQLAWLEPYLTLVRDDQLDAWAAEMRPMVFSKLGGDQTALWGRR